MELSYTVLGGDGGQYGPVKLDQLRGWIRDGRVIANTHVWRSDSPSWTPAASLPELGIAASAAVVEPARETVERDPLTQRQVRRGASWFYWIAGLSLFNSISALCNWSIGFYLGLGITQFIDGLLGHAGGIGTAIALTLDLVAVGLLVLFGIFANKFHAWAFIVGMILLALDTIVVGLSALLIPSEWIGVGLHAWALFSIFTAFKASRAS
jgi:hypothetical protein